MTTTTTATTALDLHTAEAATKGWEIRIEGGSDENAVLCGIARRYIREGITVYASYNAKGSCTSGMTWVNEDGGLDPASPVTDILAPRKENVLDVLSDSAPSVVAAYQAKRERSTVSTSTEANLLDQAARAASSLRSITRTIANRATKMGEDSREGYRTDDAVHLSRTVSDLVAAEAIVSACGDALAGSSVTGDQWLAAVKGEITYWSVREA